MRSWTELAGANGHARLRDRVRAAGPSEATIVCIPRHGHGTARVCIDSVYAHTRRRFKLIYVDVASPPAVAAHLAGEAMRRDGFFHLRIDELVSRQTARLLGLDLVSDPRVVFLDNNMLVSPGWLGHLLDAAEESGAAMVSPIIVTQGGDIHFSAGFVKRRFGRVVRPHFQRGGPVRCKVSDARLERVDIDFAESHCCLAETAAVRLPGVLREDMHNAQTLCYAAYLLGRRFGRRTVIEPRAVTSIVPISFGYDVEWMCRSYMDRRLLVDSYRHLRALMGRGPGTDLEPALAWHSKHFRYLLTTLPLDDRLTRADLLAAEEVPDEIRGYDHPLRPDADARIRRCVLPHVERTQPELASLLESWLAPPRPARRARA